MEMNQPIVSLIVPVYNVENYVAECIQSILKQTYTNIEILLIDDGSTDGSFNVCKEYAEKDSRIKYFRKENGGLSDARKYGIERASGEFLLFVDSDDWITEDAVQSLVDAQEKYQVKMVVANYNYYNEFNGVFYFHVSNEDYFERAYDKVTLMNELPSIEDSFPCFISSWGILISRDLFEHVRFPFGRVCEDIGTNYKLYFQCDEVVYIHRSIYWYRMRENSIMSGRTTERLMRDEFEMRMERIATVALLGGDTKPYKSHQLHKLEVEWLPNCVGKLENSPLHYQLLSIRKLLSEEKE